MPGPRLSCNTEKARASASVSLRGQRCNYMYRAELGSLITVWEAGFLPPGQRWWSSWPPSACGRPSLPGCQGRVSTFTLGCWAEQVPESMAASVTQGFGGGGRHLELPSPCFHPGTLHILVELIFLTSMPSSLSPRPQYPEFSQDREKITKTRPGKGKSPTLGSLFV